METLGRILVIVLLFTIAICLVKIEQYIKRLLIKKAEKKAVARRNASKPRIFAKVRKEYAINRNRRRLWEQIENKEVKK